MNVESVERARGRDWIRRCALGVLAGLLGFVLCTAIAMRLYPGGNWLDPSAPGHDFFRNFFCDLSQPTSLSGVNNRIGSGFAQVGMWCFALALAGFFWLVPLHFAPSPSGGAGLRRSVRGLGECAVLGVALVPLFPSQRFGHFHGRLALAASALGIVAALVAAAALFRARGWARWLGALGASALVVAVLDAALFAYHLNDAGPTPLFIPAAQKIAALLLGAWIVGAVWPLCRTLPASVTRRP